VGSVTHTVSSCSSFSLPPDHPRLTNPRHTCQTEAHMGKATKAEVNYRVAKVIRLLANGVQRPDILEYARKEWNISRASTDTLIRLAKDEIKESINEQRDEFLARKIYQLEDVLMKAAKRENHNAMIGCIRLQCEIAQILK
jgi:hypothetical protein